MIRIPTILVAATLPASAFAASFERPMPQAQSATAEFWFLAASIAFVVSLIAVGWLIRRR